MNTFLLFVVGLLSVIVLFVYYKADKFNQFTGVLLFVLGILALGIRTAIRESYPAGFLYNPQTLLLSFVVLGVPSLVFIFFCLKSEGFKKGRGKFVRLILPYLFFGALQQAFFLFVATDILFFLIGDRSIVFLLSLLFFFSFHLNWEVRMRRFWPLLLLFFGIDLWIYLYLGNIIPQVLFHGVLATFLFSSFSTKDQLKRRFS